MWRICGDSFDLFENPIAKAIRELGPKRMTNNLLPGGVETGSIGVRETENYAKN